MNDSDVEARLMQQEARIALAEQKQKSHEDICAIRYGQITDTLKEILLNQKEDKQKTASLEKMASFLVGGGRTFFVVSMVIATIIAVLKLAGLRGL